jgi:hypothetical protein
VPDLGDLGDLVDKVEHLVGEHKGEVEDGIDAAADFVGDQIGVDDKTMRSVKQTAKGLVDDVGGPKPAKSTTKKPTKKPTKQARAPKQTPST